MPAWSTNDILIAYAIGSGSTLYSFDPLGRHFANRTVEYPIHAPSSTIANGFYYDFFFPETTDPETGDSVPSRKLTDQDLKQVKKRMDKIIGKNYPIEREEVTREEAKRRIEEINEPFKLEILDSIQTEPITIYKIGEEWWDLCAGPHVESTGKLPKKAIQLQSVAGAYWRGDENREMLQRIYATAWKDPKQLKQYKKMMEEAKKRDHRVLGKKLGLFSIQVSAIQ